MRADLHLDKNQTMLSRSPMANARAFAGCEEGVQWPQSMV